MKKHPAAYSSNTSEIQQHIKIESERSEKYIPCKYQSKNWYSCVSIMWL